MAWMGWNADIKDGASDSICLEPCLQFLEDHTERYLSSLWKSYRLFMMYAEKSIGVLINSSKVFEGLSAVAARQRVEPFSLEETSVVMMADQRTMVELLQAPTEGCRDAIVIPAILAENFELKHGLLNLVTSKQFYGFEKEDPHAHIRWFNKITSTIKYIDVPNSSIKLMLFPFSIKGAARIWLEKEPRRSILT
ncbi:hypothetical protein Tco_0534998 [Tanacetum coccineum]